MLFYIKRHLWLEFAVTILLGGSGVWAIQVLHLPLPLKPSAMAMALGVAGSVWLALWTFLVQYGYRFFKGSSYAEQLTASLAKEYRNPTPAQILLGGITAACGEELFFRGFIQQWLGIVVASVLFMVAHFGKKDIRVVSYWSVAQGFYLGIFFAYSQNLIVPMIAHGLFDMGGMIYFRIFMSRLQNEQV